MQNDLISRSKLHRSIARENPTIVDGLQHIRLDAVLAKVSMAPGVTVPHETHAEWEVRKGMIVCSGDNGCYEGLKWHVYTRDMCFDGKLPKFCPFCGAKMDGGDVT